MNLLEFVEQSLAKGDSTVRYLREDMNPEKYDAAIKVFQDLEKNPFLINTDEVIDIDDIVGTVYDISIPLFKYNKKWKGRVAKAIINGEFDDSHFPHIYTEWEKWINCDDVNEAFLEYATDVGMYLMKYNNKYYVVQDPYNVIFAKLLGQNIPYFPKRRIYDFNKLVEVLENM